MIDAVQVLKRSSVVDVFAEEDLRMFLPYESDAALHNKLTREVKKGNLIRLKRGLYALSPLHQRKGLHLFVIAHKLLFPSYVSLESALSHYGVVPEAVRQTTSVTSKLKTSFDTPMGRFTFEHVPLRIFPASVVRKDQEGHVFLIAHPMKALLDFIYLRKKTYERLHDLEDDLRLDLEEFANLLENDRNKEIAAMKDIYKNARVSRVVDMVLWELR